MADTNDVWYVYTATRTGQTRVSLCGSGFDTTLAVYTGSCAALAQVACNNDTCGTSSRVEFATVQGQQYRIRIAGNNGERGVFTMLISSPPGVQAGPFTNPSNGHTYYLLYPSSWTDAESDAVAACKKPALPDVDDPNKVANIPKTGKLQMDLMAMTLACDLTRVMSLMWTNSATAKPFPWLSIPEGHHELAHRGDDDADAQEKLTKINTWYAEQFAYLLAKLKAIPEAGGTVLDNTLIVWVNEHAKGNDHARHEMPYIVAGRAGGAVRTGRWMQIAGEVSHSNMWVGVMQAMGLEVTTFGNPAYCDGVIDLS